MYKRLKKGADIMPIRIDDELPAKQNLEIENIFVMSKSRANMQDIRPLKIIILNLMPTKLETFFALWLLTWRKSISSCKGELLSNLKSCVSVSS